MSCDNRTNEFLSLARDIRVSDPTIRSKPAAHGGVVGNSQSSSSHSSQQQQQQQQSDTKQKKNFQELRTFHQQAALISKDIASTSALLTQLTDRVKHKSLLFQDEDAVSINNLVVRIKQSIENLNARLDSAQKTIQQQKYTFGKNSQAAELSANVVHGLQNEFAIAASNFKSILEQRTESLKESNNFKKQIYGSNYNNTNADGSVDDEIDDVPDMTSHLQAPPPVFGGGGGGMNASHLHHANSMGALFPTLDLTSSLTNSLDTPTTNSGNGLPRPHGIAGGGIGTGTGGSSRPYSAPNTGGYSGTYSNNPPLSSLLTPSEIQRMEEESGSSQLMQLLPTQQTDYIQSRAEAMSAVETNIVELGTIFNKLAGLVNEHREMVQRVEDNVEDANTNVLMSMDVLTDTYESLKSGKMLGLKLFSILVTFIILFIIFFA